MVSLQDSTYAACILPDRGVRRYHERKCRCTALRYGFAARLGERSLCDSQRRRDLPPGMPVRRSRATSPMHVLILHKPATLRSSLRFLLRTSSLDGVCASGSESDPWVSTGQDAGMRQAKAELDRRSSRSSTILRVEPRRLRQCVTTRMCFGFAPFCLYSTDRFDVCA